MKLRYYQEEAVAAVYNHLYTEATNPCVVIPTGGGKSLTMASICRDAVTRWNGRVLVLAHVKELLEQTAGTLRRLAPDVSVGVYSAGLGSRDTGEPVIVAGIQSVYQKADVLGHFDLIIVDEAHLIPCSSGSVSKEKRPSGANDAIGAAAPSARPASDPEDGEGMYRTFLQAMKAINPNVRLIGFTATPYRLKSGMICGPDNLLNEICYEVGVKELIARGFLCPLKSKGSVHAVDTSNLHLRGGEFVADEVETLMGADAFEQAACREIVQRTKDCNSVLVFAATVARAETVCKLLAKISGQECAVVTGEISASERDLLLRRFKREPVDANLFGDLPSRHLKYLVNVNVLTTGFDAPNIDCIVLLRPTASPGLYYQMVGRGFRLHESKKETLVLDYGNNIMRHGPVDQLSKLDRGRLMLTSFDSPVTPTVSQRLGGYRDATPVRCCPKCYQIVHAAVSSCSDCGYEFPKREVNHEREASSEGVISGETTDTTYTVYDIEYSVHTKKGSRPTGGGPYVGEAYCDGTASSPQTVRIDYLIQRCHGYDRTKSEWVCPEHSGWARKKFENWWTKRSNAPPPDTAQGVVDIAQSNGILPTVEITVRKTAGEKYDRIIDHKLADQHAAGPQYAPGYAVAPDIKPVCGGCVHFAYGYCTIKHDRRVTPETDACEGFLDQNDEPGDIPF